VTHRLRPAKALLQKFSADWSPPEAGEYELRCRATDDEGRIQPVMGARNSIYAVNVVVEPSRERPESIVPK